ncbi:MAG: MTH1187 family thiamine-binding protein [Bacteroidales bacterium]|nr:MTH1187 family thiamine-binding protein [Bacteroidales bacterium]MBN2756932.1 MTH1187 family thiamine-binding protein [Bacteroidales bacterium]
MSVLLEFAIFPTDKGISVSNDVSKVLKMIKESGISYKLTAMGTIIETSTLPEALDIVNKSYEILEKNSDRVYSTITIDIKKEGDDRIEKKVQSIESKIGSVNK